MQKIKVIICGCVLLILLWIVNTQVGQFLQFFGARKEHLDLLRFGCSALAILVVIEGSYLIYLTNCRDK